MSIQRRTMCDQCGYEIRGEHTMIEFYGPEVMSTSPPRVTKTEHYHTYCINTILEDLHAPDRDNTRIVLYFRERAEVA